MSRTKINKVYVVGTLTEVKTRTGVAKNGKDYIGGSFVVKTNINNVENMVEFKVFAWKTKKDGTASKQYDTFTRLEGKLNSRVRVSGDLRDNSMVNSSGELIHFNEIHASFINDAKSTDLDASTFEYSGFVVKGLYERRNKNDDLLGYRIEVAQANYDDSNMQVLKFDIDKDDTKIAEVVESNYLVGTTIEFNGTLIYTSRTETKEEEVAFGDPIVKTITISDKAYRIIGGKEPIDPESQDAYTQEDITKLVAAYKQSDADTLEKAKTVNDVAAEEETPTAASQMSKLTRAQSLI